MNEEAKSILNLNGLYFSKIDYSRQINGSNSFDYEMNFTRRVETEKDEEHFRVSLSSNIKSKDNTIKLEIIITGLFECKCDDYDLKKALINENAIAILFPYLRSQISLVTTQPSLPPIVIPPVNIVNLFKDTGNNSQ